MIRSTTIALTLIGLALATVSTPAMACGGNKVTAGDGKVRTVLTHCRFRNAPLRAKIAERASANAATTQATSADSK